MAKKSMIARQEKRQELVAKYADRREALKATARDESLWRSLCEQHWPSGPNLSSCRASFSSANGFAHLRRLPIRQRAVVAHRRQESHHAHSSSAHSLAFFVEAAQLFL